MGGGWMGGGGLMVCSSRLLTGRLLGRSSVRVSRGRCPCSACGGGGALALCRMVRAYLSIQLVQMARCLPT